MMPRNNTELSGPEIMLRAEAGKEWRWWSWIAI
jgi:hypothetical protein